jgi:hypothetical protein
MINLTIALVAQAVWSQMMEQNLKGMEKVNHALIQDTIYPGTVLERLRKTTKTFSQIT